MNLCLCYATNSESVSQNFTAHIISLLLVIKVERKHVLQHSNWMKRREDNSGIFCGTRDKKTNTDVEDQHYCSSWHIFMQYFFKPFIIFGYQCFVLFCTNAGFISHWIFVWDLLRRQTSRHNVIMKTRHKPFESIINEWNSN